MTKIVFLGEAYGETEDELKRPFVGSSGIELTRMIFEANWEEDDLWRKVIQDSFYAEPQGVQKLHWYDARETWMKNHEFTFTNVFNLRPPGNHIEALCIPKTELPPGYPNITPIIKSPKAWYVRPEYLDECRRALSEIAVLKPNLVVCLGNTACWLMLQATNIGSIRGAVAMSRTNDALDGGMPAVKCLPTYHPAGVMRNWSWRPIVLADLMKAAREGEFPELRRPSRQVIVNPSLSEVQDWTRDVLANPPELLSVDCETERGQITCIGFAPSVKQALIVPFIKPGGDRSYWPTLGAELAAWDCVARLLESGIPLLGQNFLYDLQYILPMGIWPRNLTEDTMLLHHSLFPEMQKGLGFLGSIYTNEASWKLMRRGKMDTEKRDE